MRNPWQEELVVIGTINEVHWDQSGHGRWPLCATPVGIIFWAAAIYRLV